MKNFNLIKTCLELITRPTKELSVLYRVFTTKSYWYNMVKAHYISNFVYRKVLELKTAYDAFVSRFFSKLSHLRVVEPKAVSIYRISRIIPVLFTWFKSTWWYTPSIRGSITRMRAESVNMPVFIREFLATVFASKEIWKFFIPRYPFHIDIITYWDGRASNRAYRATTETYS